MGPRLGAIGGVLEIHHLVCPNDHICLQELNKLDGSIHSPIPILDSLEQSSTVSIQGDYRD